MFISRKIYKRFKQKVCYVFEMCYTGICFLEKIISFFHIYLGLKARLVSSFKTFFAFVSLWGIHKAVIHADIIRGITEFIQMALILIIPTFIAAVSIYHLHDKKINLHPKITNYQIPKTYKNELLHVLKVTNVIIILTTIIMLTKENPIDLLAYTFNIIILVILTFPLTSIIYLIFDQPKYKKK